MNHQLLAGKRGVIFGALDEQSIAWKVAERCHEEGGRVLLTNAPANVKEVVTAGSAFLTEESSVVVK